MKHDDRRRMLGLTWIGWLNLVILQWTGHRLAAKVDEHEEHVGFAIRRWWPLSGWLGPYRSASVAVAGAIVAVLFVAIQ